jgi:hypothetical protein
LGQFEPNQNSNFSFHPGNSSKIITIITSKHKKLNFSKISENKNNFREEKGAKSRKSSVFSNKMNKMVQNLPLVSNTKTTTSTN